MFAMYCFVFKQKTAYEVRVSDWSSDVCSSDLDDLCRQGHLCDRPVRQHRCRGRRRTDRDRGDARARDPARYQARHLRRAWRRPGLDPVLRGAGARLRSEEHTSELQSLMRISYAVFCLKTKSLPSHTISYTDNI